MAANEDCERLIRVMNHKLSQPLTALRCDLELMLLDPAYRSITILEGCVASVDSVSRFLYDFQALCQASTAPVSMQNFDLMLLVEEGVEAFSGEGKDAILKRCRLNDAMLVYGARDRVRQAICLVSSYMNSIGDEWSVRTEVRDGECAVYFELRGAELQDLRAAMADPLTAIDRHPQIPRELAAVTAARLMASCGGSLSLVESETPALLMRLPLANAHAATLR